MPKYTVSKLMYGGHFDWVIRIQLHPKGEDAYYVQESFPKKEYTFEQVALIRNKMLAKYEEQGLRKMTGGYNSKTIGIERYA